MYEFRPGRVVPVNSLSGLMGLGTGQAGLFSGQNQFLGDYQRRAMDEAAWQRLAMSPHEGNRIAAAYAAMPNTTTATITGASPRKKSLREELQADVDSWLPKLTND